MSDKLPQPSPTVKDEAQQLEFYPDARSSVGQILEIIAAVDACLAPPRRVPWRERERYALLAIDAVSYLVRNSCCLCLACLQVYAEESEYLALCLRFQVRRETGRPALKIAHSDTERK